MAQTVASANMATAHINPEAPMFETKHSADHLETMDGSESIKNIDDTPVIVIDEAENRRLRRMAHRRVLPLMCLAYMMQALDKSTLGPASIMGWIEDTGAKGQDYALTSTFMWAGLIVGEPFAGQLARRFSMKAVLSIAMFTWSALLLGMGFSLNVIPVFAIRFLLGASEAVFGPILLTITVQWYLKDEQPFVQTIWQSMLGGVGILVNLMSYAFYHAPRGAGRGYLVGWQWLHVTIAIISFISSAVIWFFLPDSPETAKWASPELKLKFAERVKANAQSSREEGKVFRKEQAWECVKDPLTWLLFSMTFFNTLVVGGVNTFNNLLIARSFGFDVLTTLLLGIPLAVLLISLYMLMAYLVTRTKETCLCMIGYCTINIIGTIVLITVPPTPSTRVGLLIAFYAMQCFQACNPSIFTLLSRNHAGQTKKSISYATTFMGWAGGNAIAPQLFQSVWAPRYLNSLYIHLGLYAVFIGVCLFTRTMLIRRNKRKIASQTRADGTIESTDLSGEDLTDFHNPNFRYSI